ncbi:MAG TPA: DUF998 domain-containing protein [Anaerolineales bacterium]|nr:DUF998 domain-containing protein [Anaerolineales bacterium]
MPFDLLRWFAFIGTGLTILGCIASAVPYRGKRGERYSLLNHFISELGEVGVSRFAWTFNLGMILGGICLLPYIVGLGLKFGSLLGWLGTAAGIVAAVAVACVGFFPMSNIDPHIKAAVTYFRAGLVMVFFFGLAILFQPAGHRFVPQAANLLSLVAFVIYATFLIMMTPKKPTGEKNEENSLDPAEKPERPRVWLFPMVEWAVFFATILWLFGMAFFV